MTAPKRYNRILFTAAGALLLAAFGISLLIGAYPLTAQDILSALSGGEGMAVKVFWRLRLPRSLAAMVSGMALGVCGAVYQILFANPLAAPDIMGVSGGATLGAAMAIVWGNTAFSAPAAFLGGMAALAGSLLLTRASGSRGTGAMVLSGVLISALMKMGVMLLKTFADTEGELAAIEFFTMGSFADITAAALPALLSAAALGLALLTLLHRQIGLLSLPDDDVIRQGKQPNLSMQQRQQRKPQRRRGKQRGQSRRRDIRKTAHRKKLNGGKLALRIGKRLEQHHAHLHQRTDQHSGKHHRARSP